jgi:cell division protein ZapA (FtsZ GTPase activity inhibitor)
VAGRRSVAIRVQGLEYRVRTDASPDELQRVADLVEATMNRLRERTGAVDTRELAMMAAVNLARDLLAERRRRGPSVVSPRMGALADRVEALLEADSPLR